MKKSTKAKIRFILDSLLFEAVWLSIWAIYLIK